MGSWVRHRMLANDPLEGGREEVTVILLEMGSKAGTVTLRKPPSPKILT